jgi:microcystin degradation protein MlrC
MMSKATCWNVPAPSWDQTGVIGIELDPHCHLTVKRVRLADITILYKEFPHTDVVERAEDLLTLVLRAIRKQVMPTTSLYDCRQIGSYPTTLPLMRAFVDKTAAMEGKDGVLSVSIGHCFPYSDVPELGGRILVITDNDKPQADRLATEIGQEFIAMRGRTAPEYQTTEDGITTALAFNGSPIRDGGSGRQCRRRRTHRQHHDPAPPDRTECGRRGAGPDLGPHRSAALLRRRPEGGISLAVRQQDRSGVRPADRFHGDCGSFATRLLAEFWPDPGPRLAIAPRSVSAASVLISNRTQALGLELFQNVGIEPTERKLVVVKSTNHFMAAFGPIAQKVIYVDSDGPLSRDYRTIPYARIGRPIWPLDAQTAPGLIV